MDGLCRYQAKGSSLLTERVWMTLFFPFMQAHSAAPVSGPPCFRSWVQPLRSGPTHSDPAQQQGHTPAALKHFYFTSPVELCWSQAGGLCVQGGGRA